MQTDLFNASGLHRNQAEPFGNIILIGTTPVLQGAAQLMDFYADRDRFPADVVALSISIAAKAKSAKKAVKEDGESDDNDSVKKKIEDGIKKGELPPYVRRDGRDIANGHRADIAAIDRKWEEN